MCNRCLMIQTVSMVPTLQIKYICFNCQLNVITTCLIASFMKRKVSLFWSILLARTTKRTNVCIILLKLHGSVLPPSLHQPASCAVVRWNWAKEQDFQDVHKFNWSCINCLIICFSFSLNLHSTMLIGERNMDLLWFLSFDTNIVIKIIVVLIVFGKKKKNALAY